MKILLPGGSGQIGTLLARHLHAQGNDVVVLSRQSSDRRSDTPWRTISWDAQTLQSDWTCEIEGADAIIHLSGRTVNCRYTPKNRRQIYESRTAPTRLLGEAIAAARQPPRVWMNASTSTIYRHSLDRTQDEFTGEFGRRSGESLTSEREGLPETWSFSVNVAHEWEKAFAAVPTPKTRKIALRSSMVMSPDAGGVFSVLSGLVRAGLGGTEGPGTQYVSWMHDQDYVRATDLLLSHPEIVEETAGVVNMTSPQPLSNRDFMSELRRAWKAPIGLPAASWMLEIGAIFLRTETELILKSRRVVPSVLMKHGFKFEFPTWREAVDDLVARTRGFKH
jgi:uncharacterized protein (TIGR01777 family)